MDLKKERKIYVGIDIGSTTTKVVVTNSNKNDILYANYKRHNAEQLQSVKEVIQTLKEKYPNTKMQLCMTGSGSKLLAESLSLPFVQEVVANAIAIRNKYRKVGTAIELGGQDAKIIFFHENQETGALDVSDMRMNGSCAGGTGAFIDEMASVLKTPIEEFDSLAAKGECVYDISGRCGVYAKTDIQPLMNQGVSRENLALSTFHAIAKQTIGGLAQGLDIEKPVVFEGGPLTFNPTLIRVFSERLNLSEEDVLIPEHPELMIAYGAALALQEMFQDEKKEYTPEELEALIEKRKVEQEDVTSEVAKPFFSSSDEKEAFMKRHALPKNEKIKVEPGQTLHVYLGIDSGSTTTKFVLIDEEENILDSFYAPNEGSPLNVAKKALIDMRERYKKQGVTLDIIATGTTGYGELLFANAFGAECHVVETVSHARAAAKYVDDATFVLDIGGQDMKAIWIENGIIKNIVVNEACSSGCGSFLENFASTLNINASDIAQEAFSSKNPAVLGSRCTVFMNSSIITEQRNGKLPEDIMAGLCRSIIENVFTKVIRVSNLDSLGDKIVVQGGTFYNDAVLCALEQYIGREVIRAPYPGIMGAIGVALMAKEGAKKEEYKKTFIGLDALDEFSFTQESNSPCPFCTNHCKRTIVTFSNGKTWITNNRCERGEVIGDPKDKNVQEQVKSKNEKMGEVPNMFRIRERLLFQDYSYEIVEPEKEITIGLPRVLSYWETMPFWQTFWRALGFKVKLSDFSTRKLYESGLSAVTSDTVCFPAKLVHGHLRNLVEKKVDRIFMPSITTVPSENTEKTSQSMCAVVKGYPIVIRNSDNPEKYFHIPFDSPLFHWYQNEDRKRQLVQYMKENFNISEKSVVKAIEYGDRAQNEFQTELEKQGQKILDDVTTKGTFAVILASRPYQNDTLVNHELPEMFTRLGIPVLTADSVPGAKDVELKNSRLDIVNNYHARILSTAIIAAQSDHLEYVQLVSFGCGHDAYLSDEIVRMMKEISEKVPLILKVDESDVQGPLGIRVRSFVETVSMKREQKQKLEVKQLQDPYPVKFTKKCKKERYVLVPNTSHAFSRIMSAAMSAQGLIAVPLEIGREKAIQLGKRYVHNDICFPAQIVIGEVLAELQSGKYKNEEVAVGMAKYVGDCRLTHYGALLRKALDDAGYEDVPILTNDDADYHNMHPGFKLNMLSAVRIAFALPMIDVLEELLRKIRPYELVKGSTDQAFEKALDCLVNGLEQYGIRGAKKGFKEAIDIMKNVKFDRSNPRPQVLIVGEYLLNFHPGANHDVEAYLEKNGFEIIEARMTDVIRKTYFYQDAQIKEYHISTSLYNKAWYRIANKAFNMAHDLTDSIATAHPLYKPACRMQDLVKDSDSIIHHTFDAGEGVLIPGEILHHAKHGCRSFIILQPFGCLPNHIVGRGISKKLKELYPDAQILPLDYDPDVSFANVENRLQMLIMNIKTPEATNTN